MIDDDRIVTITTYITLLSSTSTLSLTASTLTETVYSTLPQTVISTTTEYTSQTVSDTTFVTTTATIDNPIIIGKRDQQIGDVMVDPQITNTPRYNLGSEGLQARDQIIVSGNKPAYVNACRNVQAYAVACLCWGIKAATVKAAPKTSIKTIFRSSTTVSTSYATKTTTVTSERYSQTTTVVTVRSTSTQTDVVTSVTTTTVNKPTVLSSILDRAQGSPILRTGVAFLMSENGGTRDESVMLTITGQDSELFLTGSDPRATIVLATKPSWVGFGILAFRELLNDSQYTGQEKVICYIDTGSGPADIRCGSMGTYTQMYYCNGENRIYLGIPNLNTNGCVAMQMSAYELR